LVRPESFRERGGAKKSSFLMLTSASYFYSLEMVICYILRSKYLEKFYIGYTTDIIEKRIEKHNTGFYGNKKYTFKTDDWELFYSIACESKLQAIKIEQHIKKMKSKIYILNLIKYPEISKKLLLKYKS
jgi:putative endonuclease